MRRLLYIAHRVPYPPDKGERVRAFQEIKALAGHFRITLATLTHSKEDRQAAECLRQWCKRIILAPAGGKRGLARGAVSLIGGRSITEGYFESRSLIHQIRKLAQIKKFHLALGYSSSTLEYLLTAPVSHRIMDLIDVDSAKWFTYAKEARWPKSWLYDREGRAVRQLEQDAIANCDTVLLVSKAESEVLGIYAKKIRVLGNGVDTDYYTPNTNYQMGGVSLVFTGTMDYRPNIEGVSWFVREVWPDLKRQMPDLSFYIVGRNPTRAVKRLTETPGVKVTGTVPDVRPYLSAAQVAVCPLNIARGVQNKILEAMATGKAVVASKPALEGLELEVNREVIRAETAEQWRQSIVQLLSRDDLRRQLGQQARQCVETKYTWSARMAPLVELCNQLAEPETTTEAIPSSSERRGRSRISALLSKRKQRPAVKINKGMALAMWLMTCAYFMVLMYGSLLPSGKRLPIIGVWDTNISPLVQNMLHMPAYAILMICISLAMTASLRHRALAIVASVLICFLIGVLMEHAQGSVPGRVVSNADIFMNSTGIMLGLPAAISWRWRHN